MERNLVQKARAALRQAEIALGTAMIEQYPAGARTWYSQGPHRIPCEVITIHSFGDRAMIRSHTGKEFWIDGARLDGSSQYQE